MTELLGGNKKICSGQKLCSGFSLDAHNLHGINNKEEENISTQFLHLALKINFHVDLC